MSSKNYKDLESEKSKLLPQPSQREQQEAKQDLIYSGKFRLSPEAERKLSSSVTGGAFVISPTPRVRSRESRET